MRISSEDYARSGIMVQGVSILDVPRRRGENDGRRVQSYGPHAHPEETAAVIIRCRRGRVDFMS